jgi:hypothetical protein
MPPILADPRLLIVLVLVILLVVGINFVLLNMLRGRQPGNREAGVWGRALGGARRAQAKQVGDYEKLRQAVSALQSQPAEKEPTDE